MAKMCLKTRNFKFHGKYKFHAIQFHFRMDSSRKSHRFVSSTVLSGKPPTRLFIPPGRTTYNSSLTQAH